MPNPSAEETAELGFRRPLRLLWGLAADAFIFVWTFVLGTTAVVLTLVTRRPVIIDVLGRLWCKGIVRACGIEVEVRGLDNIDPRRRYVLLSNHLSNFDIWCTLAAVPLPIHFIAKKELLRIPVLGQALALFLDRLPELDRLGDHRCEDREEPHILVEALLISVGPVAAERS